MVSSQTIMLAQVVPNMWAVWQRIIVGLSLLGPPTCPASWLASLVKRVDGEPTKRATLAPPVTPVKSSSGKSSSGSAGKKSEPKLIPDFWKEDEESKKWEEEIQHQKSCGSPILSLADHEEPVSTFTSKTALHQVSQPASHPSWVIAVAPKFRQDRGKARRPSSGAADSLDDDPLSDKEPGMKSKGCKCYYTSPVDVVVVDKDDDEPTAQLYVQDLG